MADSSVTSSDDTEQKDKTMAGNTKLEDQAEESEPHPSGVSYVQISLWTGEDNPGNSEPAEKVGMNVRVGENYAVNGENVEAAGWLKALIDSHLSGECDCLHE